MYCRLTNLADPDNEMICKYADEDTPLHDLPCVISGKCPYDEKFCEDNDT